MINLKNLKSLFVVDEEQIGKPKDSKKLTAKKGSPAKKPVKTTPKKPSTPPKKNVKETAKEEKRNNRSGATKRESSTPRKGAFDKRSYDALMKAIENRNMKGFDYLEYKNSLKALASLNMDEATKFKSAYATASTMGLTVDKLVHSIDFYAKVLDDEKENFRKVLKGQVEQHVLGKEKEREQLNNLVQQKSEQIKKLTAEINQAQANLSKIQGQIDNVKSKITDSRDKFLMTYDYVNGHLEADKAKILKYLK